MLNPELRPIVLPMDHEWLSRTWKLRLQALEEHPDAFGQPWAEAVELAPRQVGDLYESFWNASDNRVFIAIDHEHNVGGMIGVVRDRPFKTHHRMEIWGLYVAPEWRGEGLGKELLDNAIDYCRSVPGVLQVQLQVASANREAIRAYKNVGFKRWGRLPRADILNGVALDNDFMILMLDDDAGSQRD